MGFELREGNFRVNLFLSYAPDPSIKGGAFCAPIWVDGELNGCLQTLGIERRA
jgi:hypothetical protein